MRMSELLVRESFGILLVEALTRFYKKDGQCIDIRWIEGRPNIGDLEKKGYQPWIGNIYTNALFRPDCKKIVYEPLSREFSRSLIWWKRLFQKAYIMAAFSKQFSKYLCQNGIAIKTEIPDSQYKVIIPGNHKIRILDFKNNICYSVMKNGYPKENFLKEIELRRQIESYRIPVPKIIGNDKINLIMTEAIVVGTPLNRLPLKLRNSFYLQARAALNILLQNTKRIVGCTDYVNKLDYEFCKLLSNSKNLNESLLNVIGVLKVSILKTLEEYKDNYIMIGLSHGDFQAANILCADNQVLLIDWEYADFRQYGFDYLMYNLETRSPFKLSQRLRCIVLNELSDDECISYFGTIMSQKQIVFRLFLFMFEELVIRMYENSFTFINTPDSGLMIYVNEMVEFFRYYEKHVQLRKTA